MTTFVEILGDKLAVNLFEPENSIGDVVLVHGFTGSKEDFIEVGPLLAAQGYRVLTFDNRGQHESSPSSREDAYSMKSLARDVIELSQHYGFVKPHLFGHSFGGLVTQRAVVEAPDYWSSLTLFCSGPHWIPDKPHLPKYVEVLENISPQDAWNTLLEAERKGHPLYDLHIKRWLKSDIRSTREMAKLLISEQSVISEIAAIKIPVHVVYGETDDAWPLSMQDQMAEELSALRTIIKDAGHCPNEDQPEETAKVLANFWKSL
jgi:pimeloyl-ACP methyl ester carboxylesterase